MSIGDFGAGRGHIGINALDLDGLPRGLALVEVAFETAKVSWLRKDGVVGICHVCRILLVRNRVQLCNREYNVTQIFYFFSPWLL